MIHMLFSPEEQYLNLQFDLFSWHSTKTATSVSTGSTYIIKVGINMLSGEDEVRCSIIKQDAISARERGGFKLG